MTNLLEIESFIRNSFKNRNMELKSVETFDEYEYPSYIKSKSDYGIIIKDEDNIEYEISITIMD